MQAAALARLWSLLVRRGDCWEYTGPLASTGYGKLGWRGETTTHRVMWRLLHPDETLTEEDMVLHTCDYRPCCHPLHIYRGDHLQNCRDAYTRGRLASGERNGHVTHPEQTPRGERNGMARLTQEQVNAIRSIPAGSQSYAALGREYGVSATMIRNIALRHNWRNH